MARVDTSKIPSKKISASGLKDALQLYKYIKPYWVEYTFGLLFLFGSSLTNLAFPKLLGDLVNSGNEGSLGNDINRLAIWLGGLLILQSTFSFFRTWLLTNVTEKTLATLRQHTYNHIIKLPLQFFEKRRVGELNSRISADISLLQETLTSTLAEFTRQVVIIVGGITLLVFTSVKLTLFMLAILPAVVLLVVFFGRFIRKYSKDAQNEVAESNTIVEETLQGIQSVKAFTNEFFEMLRYKKRTDDIAKIGMKGGIYRGAFSAFLILGLFGSLVAVIWKGASLMASGEMEAGELFSFVLYSGFIGGTIGGMANVFTRIQKFLGATEDLFSIFNEVEEDLKEEDIVRGSEVLSGNIELKDLKFAYPSRPNEDVIKGIDAKIEANQMIALVGGSGAGKSTLATLLLRLHTPTSGEILIDGIPSKEYALSKLRSQIALVPQDIFLFGGSIKENIAYGNPGASEEEITLAAKRANAWEFIDRFPEGLETIVGERGTQLSGGQRQRVAIARALLKDPKILILDEATSSLDSESELLVQEALEELMKGRTSIVIAHRLATIRKADSIYVMQHGKIIETGKHEDLVKLENGVYKKLSDLQNLVR